MLTDIGSTPMIQSGSGDGMFGGGGGLFGGFLLGTLLSRGGGLFGGGNDGAGVAATAGIAENISDMRYEIPAQTIQLQSDIFANRLSEVTDTLTQTNAINAQFANMAMAQCNSTYALNNAIKDCCCNTQLGIANVNTNILKSDYDNQIRTLESTNKLSGEIAAAFCKVDQDVKDTAFNTQLRDLQNKADSDSKFSILAVGQNNIIASINAQQKENEIFYLTEKIKDYEHGRRCYINADVNIKNNDKNA